MPFFNTTFTAPAGTAATAVSHELGTLVAVGTVNAIVSDANRLRNGVVGYSSYKGSVAPASANYSIGLDIFYAGPLSTEVYLLSRYNYTTSSGYVVGINANQITLYRRDNGTDTTIATVQSLGQVVNQSRRVELLCENTLITVKLDGAIIAQATSATYAGANEYGFAIGSAGNTTTNTNGYHIDNFRADYLTSVTGTIVPVDNANIQYSPYNVKLLGSTSAHLLHAGSYVKFKFTGTTLAINLDMSFNATTISPTIRAVVDNEIIPDISITGSTTQITVSTSLVATTHTAEIYLLQDDNNNNRGNGKAGIKITGFVVASGQGFVASPTPSTENWLLYGDSYFEYVPRNPNVSGSGALENIASWPNLVVRTRNVNYGIVGFSGQGYTNSYNSGTPTFPNSWANFYTGESRLVVGLLSPQPSVIVVAQGVNELPGVNLTTLSSTIISTIQAIRAAAPNARIVMVAPWTQQHIATFISAYNTLRATDKRVYLIDLGAEGQKGMTGSAANYYTIDGVHPYQRRHAEVAGLIQFQLTRAITPVNKPVF